MQTRQEYNQQFLEALEQLNPAQRQAVEQTEGPMLVIAGPGTGKTHILSARIGRILLETDTPATSILCLTFTDAGVKAMRDRLLQFIGPEAHRVQIYTFHSFCNSIIQDNMAYFGRQDLEPLSDLERIELIRQLIDELPPAHLLRRRSDPYYYEEHLATLFQQLKAENWTVPYVQEQIAAYLDDLPRRKAFRYQRKHGTNQKGDLKEAQFAKEQQDMELLSVAVDLYPVYERAKYAARRYDYNDMIQWVITAFAEHEDLLRTYQERYLYFLIDEFQDTNGAQHRIVQYLASYWDVPNIFIVGDDDQSIFEFQGARLQNLTDFYHDYRDDVEVIMLQQNYRSTQQVLNQAARLIHRNEIRLIRRLEELALEKNLHAAHPQRQQQTLQPRLVEYPNRRQEITDIVQQIEHRRAQGEPLDEIAIIYARHQQAEDLINLLEQKKIPYQTRRKINVLDLPAVQQFRTLLEWVAHELERPGTGDQLLFKLLHFNFWELHLPDLITISLHLAEAKERRNWRQLIADAEWLATLALKKPDQFLAVSQLLEMLLSDAANRTLPEFAERLLNRTGLLDRALNTDDPTGQIEVLSTFFNFIRQEARRSPRMTVRDLLVTLDRMESNRLPLSLERVIDTHRGVQLLTAHSAKGLEFNRVFLFDCTKRYWEPKNRSARYQLKLPDTLTLSGEEDPLEARRRLFYVAMTRARYGLQISYGQENEQGKEVTRAVFVDELMGKAGLSLEQHGVPEKEMLEAERLQLQERPSPLVAPHHGAAVARILEHFQLSISALNKYLYCPLAFYFESVLRVPYLQSEAAVYGLAAHGALQRLFESMQQSKPRQFPSRKAFLQYFSDELDRQRFQLPAEQIAGLRQKGQYRLGQYYQQKLGTWNRRVVLEYTVRHAEVEGVPLTGTIDKLEFMPRQEVRIVDYKTGSHNTSKLKGPTKSNPHGGSFWRQLVFYKLMYDSFDQQGHRCLTGAIAYLDPDPSGQFPEEVFEYEVRDTEALKPILRDTYEKIMNHQFYEGCGEDSCTWCQFVRQHVRPDSFRDPLTEELDDR
mgnify:FL=1